MRASARRLGAVAIMVLVALGSFGPGARGADTVPSGPAPAVLAPAVPGSAVPGSGAQPTARGVTAAIGPILSKRLKGGSAVVMDSAGHILLNDEGADANIPASTLKLATAVAALSSLGPNTRIPTTVYRRDNTLFLVGGGDPTLVRTTAGRGAADRSPSLRALAAEAVTGFTANTDVDLVYDTSAFTGPTLGPGWSANYPAAGVAAPVTALVVDGGRVRPGSNARVRDPARQAAVAFAGFLKSKGLHVTSVQRGALDRSANEIARVRSAPVSDIVERMLTDSENNYAEALAHLVGGAVLGEPSFAGGAAGTTKALQGMGIDTDATVLVDGSGLSRKNSLTAVFLAGILSAAVRQTNDAVTWLLPGLPIAGMTGTLEDRFGTAATRAGRGFVHAKTGTLTGVVSLAGTVLDKNENVMVFAFMANSVKSINTVRDTMDRIASRLARCGCS